MSYSINESDRDMLEIGYKYLYRTNHSYNIDMIMDPKQDLKQFNSLFNAGFNTGDDDNPFSDTEDNIENTNPVVDNKGDINEIVKYIDDPFSDTEDNIQNINPVVDNNDAAIIEIINDIDIMTIDPSSTDIHIESNNQVILTRPIIPVHINDTDENRTERNEALFKYNEDAMAKYEKELTV